MQQTKKKRYSTFEEKPIAIRQTTILFKGGKYILMKSLLTMVCFCKFQMQRPEIPNHKKHTRDVQIKATTRKEN